MYITDLKTITQFAIDSGYMQRDVANNILKEIAETERRLKPDENLWKGEVHLIGASDVCNTLNYITYDTYGELYRSETPTSGANEQPSFDEYKQAVAQSYDLTSYTDEMLHAGYDICVDLFDDNEAAGEHDEQGHFVGCK